MLNSEQDAEDAIQEIFLKTYKAIPSYTPKISFNSWIYKIAYNHCMNILRKRKLNSKLDSILKLDSSNKYLENFDTGVFSPHLEEIFFKVLRDEERNLMILHVFHEKNYQEIAEIIGKSPEAIRKKISRIKEKIKIEYTKSRKEDEQCVFTM
ncbi:sigma-70 family RNA polymerase sigma factor [Paenibacillus sp. MER 78]|nr:sigma-70 family RNA polymerase sigma factor [Paenibacillus sp. MER 78]